jgi:hypothetical protein
MNKFLIRTIKRLLLALIILSIIFLIVQIVHYRADDFESFYYEELEEDNYHVKG